MGLYWRARSSEKLGAAVLRQAGLAAPNSGRVHFLLAELYRQKNQENKAAAEYEKALEIQPNDVAARLGLADAYSMSTDFDKATAELKRVFSLDPGQPDANYLMGKILVYQHQYAEAVPYLEKALKGNTARVAEVHALISKVYASQGRTSDAISELQRSLGADQDGSLHYELAMLYRKAGDAKAAAAALEQSRLIFQQRQGRMVQDTVIGPLDSQSKPSSP
jgi:tetratricopeptide (TPR) repeat protein